MIFLSDDFKETNDKFKRIVESDLFLQKLQQEAIAIMENQICPCGNPGHNIRTSHATEFDAMFFKNSFYIHPLTEPNWHCEGRNPEYIYRNGLWVNYEIVVDTFPLYSGAGNLLFQTDLDKLGLILIKGITKPTNIGTNTFVLRLSW